MHCPLTRYEGREDDIYDGRREKREKEKQTKADREGEGDEEHGNIAANVERGIGDKMVYRGAALGIWGRHGPIVVKGTTPHTKV